MKRRQVFSREFKLEAIRLLEEGKKPAADIARELGIRRNQLYKWKEQRDKQGAAVFPGEGRRSSKSSDSEEIARLRSEVAKIKEENEILKKAAG
jgi:transposase-like protein